MPTFPLVQDGSQDNWWDTTGKGQMSSGFTDSVSASAQQAVDASPVAIAGDLYAMHKLNQIEGVKTLSQDELNQKYKGTGIEWNGPQKENVAEYIAKEHDRRQKLQQRIEMAGGGVGTSVMDFATRMFINYPEYALAGGAAGGAMRLAGVASEMGLAGRMATGFAENAVGVAPIELANVYRDRQEMMDVGMTDVLKNAAVAGLLGAGIHGAFGARPGDAERARIKAREEGLPPPPPPPEASVMQEVAANQMLEGKRPMVQPLVSMLQRERAGEGARPVSDASGRAESNYQDLGTSESVKGIFYNGTEGRVENQGMVPPQPIESGGVYLGVGQGGVSDIFKANADSLPTSGIIHQMEVEGKLAPVDVPMPDKVKGIVEKSLAEMGEPNLIKDDSLRDVFANLTNPQIDAINKKLQDAGYDGLHYEGGSDTNPHNGIVVFPERAPDTVRPMAALEPDQRFSGAPSKEELQKYLEAYNAPQNDLLHSEDDLAKQAAVQKRLDEGKFTADDESFVDEQHQAAKEQAKALLAESENLSKEDRAILEEIMGKKAEEKPGAEPEPTLQDKAKMGETTIKAITNCVGNT